MSSTRALQPDDADFPAAMQGLPGSLRRRPLYIRGQLPTQPGIAVVGTREASAGALAMTAELARAAAGAGFSIWSGGARGIDARAHEAALDAAAPTVVVTAGGLDDPYPRKHEPLYARVLDAGGALVSLEPDGARRMRFQFPRRNYVLAGLTHATVVVQARDTGGTRHTARAARRLRRPLFVVPDAPWSRRGSGSAYELAAGAIAVATAADLLAELERIAARWHAGTQLDLFAGSGPVRAPPARRARRSAPADLGDDERRLLEALNDRPVHPDRLCRATGLSYRAVSAALLALCLEGLVLEAPAGHYRRLE